MRVALIVVTLLAAAAAAVAAAAASAAGAAAGSSSSSSAPAKFVWLVVREDCWDTLVGLHLLSPPFLGCATASISKGLGYAIIAGATVVKLPQVAKILAARSVAGISRGSTYLEFLSNVLATAWYVIKGTPFSAYGETVIVAAGSLLIVLLVWRFDPPGGAHVAAVTAGAAAALGVALQTPGEHLYLLQLATFAIFAASRLAQIAAVASARSVGSLAFLTLALNFAGTAARVFTSAKEVGDPTQLRITAVNAGLNGLLLAQYLYYGVWAAGAAGAKDGAAGAANGVPKGKGKAAAAAAAVAGEAAAPARPVRASRAKKE
jgi:mannose-P-dolichol utilization defect protein 1